MSSDGAPIGVGVLGFGTVGSGVYRMLQDNAEAISSKAGATFEVKQIAVRDLSKHREAPSNLVTDDPWQVVNRPDVQVVLELMGGLEPAAELVEAALKNGKNVVTANKELIAKHGSRLVQLARSRSLDLHYEAAVGGGIPIVQPLKHQLAGNDVLKMMGILNGTTNYILTKMAQGDADYDQALAEAQANGYAEADPKADVEAYDAVYKIAILASIAYGQQVPTTQVYREGITQIRKADIIIADQLGYTIKLIAVAEPMGDGRILARVHPALLSKRHPLANVNDVYNALWFNGDFVGDVLLAGRGAGANPTASAIIGDLIDVARNIKVNGPASAIPYGPKQQMAGMGELKCRYYLRLTAIDRTDGLAKIAHCFGTNGVSINQMQMSTNEAGIAEIVALTHPATELDVQRTARTLLQTRDAETLEALIRVEE